MSLAITVYVPECIVMAADSRQSIKIDTVEPGKQPVSVVTPGSDALNKLFFFEPQKTGVVTYGDTMPEGKTVASFLERFSTERLEPEDKVGQVAGKLRGFFFNSHPQADTAFHVAGFEKQGRQSVPHVYHVTADFVRRVNIVENSNPAEVIFGCTWGGEADVMASLFLGPGPEGKPKPPVVWAAFSPQDAIDFSLYAMRTTIDTMRFQARPKSVGGPIDILLLTPTECSFIKKKKIGVDV